MEIDPNLLLQAYASGIFPMSDDRDASEIYWVEPKMRGILPLDNFHLSRSLKKRIKSNRFQLTVDQAFPEIIRLCAESAPDRQDTWINQSIEQAFLRLHARGFAHSVECWDGDRLAGGLYGLALGRAFFGESMVTRVTDASKVALAHLVARLQVGGYSLLDCQFSTEHLATLGVVEIPQHAYMELLDTALDGVTLSTSASDCSASGDFFSLDGAAAVTDGAATVSAPLSLKVISQLLGQTS